MQREKKDVIPVEEGPEADVEEQDRSAVEEVMDGSDVEKNRKDSA